MKAANGRHKMNPGLWKPVEHVEPVLSERYRAEIDTALRRAEREWKAAEKAAVRAAQHADREPSPTNVALCEQTGRAVLARLDELQRIEKLMQVRTTPKKPVRIVNKARTL